MASAGRFMQFVASVSMTSTPSRPALGTAAAGDQLADDVAAAAWIASPKAMTRSSPADAAGTRSGRIWASAPIMQPVMRLMVEVRALTAAGSCGLTIVPLGRRNLMGRKQPPLVGMVGSVRRPHGVARRRQRAGRHAIERPLHLRARAFEVELDVAALHRDGDLDADRLVELDTVIVEVIDEPIGALGDGCSALRVIVSDRCRSSSKIEAS